jgi:tRNA threonylcarbamoyladenosine biosynthesis protein TsaB
MKILALETSTEYCSVALWQDGIILARNELVGQKHSERLMPMLYDLLSEAGVRLLQCDGIAFGSGPGSFTGVRIACGVAQGLALGAGLPVFGITTLLALAEGVGHRRVIAALDARMGEIYCAAYEKQDEGWKTVCEPVLCKPEEAPVVKDCGWFGAGSGFAAHREVLQGRYAKNMTGMDADAVPQAADIATLGSLQFARGLGMDAACAQPFYLRDKVALKTAERELIAAEHPQK